MAAGEPGTAGATWVMDRFEGRSRRISLAKLVGQDDTESSGRQPPAPFWRPQSTSHTAAPQDRQSPLRVMVLTSFPTRWRSLIAALVPRTKATLGSLFTHTLSDLRRVGGARGEICAERTQGQGLKDSHWPLFGKIG